MSEPRGPEIDDDLDLIPPPPSEPESPPPPSSTTSTPSRKDSRETSISPQSRGRGWSGGKLESTPARPAVKRAFSPGSPETKSTLSGTAFGSVFTHNFDVVTKQVDQGQYATKRVGKVIGELARLEEEYSRNLLRVLEHEYTKIQRLSEDGMRGFASRWIECLALIKELATIHSKNSAQIMADIVEPLSAFNSDADNQKKNLMAQERKVSVEMAVAADKVRKGYQTCARLIVQCKEAHEAKKKNSHKEKQPPKSRTSAFMNNMKKAAKQYAEKFTGSIEDMQSRTYQAAVQYAIDVDGANKRQDKYLTTELPMVFSGMQQLETRRLDTLKKHLTKYTTVQMQTLRSRGEVVEKMKQTVGSIATEQDLQGFIDDWIAENGPPSPVPPFQYSLQCPPDDIKAGRFYGSPNSVFQTTIQRCMELQKDAFPDSKIPRIVTACIDGIRKFNGPKTEGIFRISADQIELEKFRERVDQGNYDLKGIDSPHMPAALLKTWLRMLAEPLIPDALYPECLDVARGSKDVQGNIKTIFGKLDELNQLIIQAIAEICNEIALPENATINRMNLNSLAIVFAPSFLRNPSADPMELLQNTKFETRFVTLLFEVLGGGTTTGAKPVVSSILPRRSKEDSRIVAATLKLTAPVPSIPPPRPSNRYPIDNGPLIPSSSSSSSNTLSPSSISISNIPLSPSSPPIVSHTHNQTSSASISLSFPADIV